MVCLKDDASVWLVDGYPWPIVSALAQRRQEQQQRHIIIVYRWFVDIYSSSRRLKQNSTGGLGAVQVGCGSAGAAGLLLSRKAPPRAAVRRSMRKNHTAFGARWPVPFEVSEVQEAGRFHGVGFPVCCPGVAKLVTLSLCFSEKGVVHDFHCDR